MTILIDESVTRSLSQIPPDAETVWLFEDMSARRCAERAARLKGRTLRLRSAYKTLLHDVLEDGLLDDASSATIRYPVVEGCPDDRFRLECYPLHALCSHCDISFEASAHEGDGLPVYEIITPEKKISVMVPVRWTHAGDESPVLAACGWLVDDVGKGRSFETEFEYIFARVCAEMKALPLNPLNPEEPDAPIFFDRLEIDAVIPASDQPLAVGNECISLAEALHEEIYFASLEVFRHRLGLPSGARTVTSGQVIPRIRIGDTPHLRMELRRCDPQSDQDRAGCPDLDDATTWLSPAEIAKHLEALQGKPYSVMSRQGREVSGRHITGAGQTMLAISAGQHPNETSPMVGALRAARDLAAEGRVNFTINPLENPDGYAVFRELSTFHPKHMHHAARYTASGADQSCGGGRHESAIRTKAFEHLPARVHLNLHGYPSHEWVRPLSGYIPQGFDQWTIPKGFFLILRYNPDEQALADLVLNAGLEALAAFKPLADQNRRMLDMYDRYVSHRAFDIHDGCIPFSVSPVADPDYRVTIITEAPDETIFGEDFRIAHEGQYRVVRAIAAALEESTAKYGAVTAGSY